MSAGPRWFEDGALHFGLGIEDTFVPQARDGERPLDEYELTEHDERFADDFALAAGVGAELLRWGVPWYRVAPEPGVWDWDWTDRAVDALLAAGLRPVIDLVHYGTPRWLDREFAHPDYPRHVAEYGARFAQRFGDALAKRFRIVGRAGRVGADQSPGRRIADESPEREAVLDLDAVARDRHRAAAVQAKVHRALGGDAA